MMYTDDPRHPFHRLAHPQPCEEDPAMMRILEDSQEQAEACSRPLVHYPANGGWETASPEDLAESLGSPGATPDEASEVDELERLMGLE